MVKYLSFIMTTMLIGFSCSKETAKSKLIGEWQLESLNSNCISNDSLIFYEIFMKSENGCGTIEITNSSNQWVLSYDKPLCSTIILDANNNGSILSGSPGEIKTNQITYTFDEITSTITICTTNNFCSEYIYNDGEISININVTTTLIQGNCQRTFLYKK